MLCNQCNTENPIEAKYCQKCGAALEIENNSQNTYKKGIRIIACIFIIAVLGITLALWALKMYFSKLDYKDTTAQAKELYAEEDYEGAVKEYKKAIDILPKEKSAYVGLSRVYRDMQEFDKSFSIMQKGEKYGLQMQEEKEELEEYKDKYDFMVEINDKLQNGKYEDVLEMVTSDEEEEEQVYEQLFFQNGKIVDEFTDGWGVIFNSWDGVYAGEIADGKRNGKGMQVGEYNGSYYYVDGEWEGNLANGQCSLYYDNYAGEPMNSMLIEGNFTDSLMDGEMLMSWKEKDEEYYHEGNAKAENGKLLSRGVTDEGKYIYVKGDSTYWATTEEGLEDNGIPIIIYD